MRGTVSAGEADAVLVGNAFFELAADEPFSGIGVLFDLAHDRSGANFSRTADTEEFDLEFVAGIHLLAETHSGSGLGKVE